MCAARTGPTAAGRRKIHTADQAIAKGGCRLPLGEGAGRMLLRRYFGRPAVGWARTMLGFALHSIPMARGSSGQ